MRSEKAEPQQLSFQIHGLHFAAQAWGNPQHQPVIALHGWLDNSASFYRLAPKLDNIYLVALDMAGHGQTDHRPGSAPYNIWDDVAEIFAIADHLGWQDFSLLGHSRGGIIAALAAGTFPERIRRLGLIEGVLPEQVRSEDTPKQLALAVRSMNLSPTKVPTIYADLESAISARENGMFPLSRSAAEELTRRGVNKIPDGYRWSTDKRLFLPSSVKLLPEQVSAFIHRIVNPVHLVLASDGLPKIYPNYLAALENYPHIRVSHLAGGHHLHMEQEADAVADVINAFFNE